SDVVSDVVSIVSIVSDIVVASDVSSAPQAITKLNPSTVKGIRIGKLYHAVHRLAMHKSALVWSL
ncbi:MAG: hypothetical protein ACPG77_12510, partial [Nannocystaceae bacterium]